MSGIKAASLYTPLQLLNCNINFPFINDGYCHRMWTYFYNLNGVI